MSGNNKGIFAEQGAKNAAGLHECRCCRNTTRFTHGGYSYATVRTTLHGSYTPLHYKTFTIPGTKVSKGFTLFILSKSLLIFSQLFHCLSTSLHSGSRFPAPWPFPYHKNFHGTKDKNGFRLSVFINSLLMLPQSLHRLPTSYDKG